MLLGTVLEQGGSRSLYGVKQHKTREKGSTNLCLQPLYVIRVFRVSLGTRLVLV